MPAHDRLLWRMAYETWARADELLTLDITDLDIAQREGIVHAKGGDRQPIWWLKRDYQVVAGKVSGSCQLKG